MRHLISPKISASFLYLPNILLVTLSDYETHTCENFYIRSSGGLDLARLSKTHKVYMNVVSGKMDVMEGSVRLREIVKSVGGVLWRMYNTNNCSLINTKYGRWF